MANYDLTPINALTARIKEAEEKGNFIPNMETKQGYEASKRFVLDVTTKLRKELEVVHKEVKAPFLDACKKIDATKKDYMALLVDIEKPHKEAYKNHDAEIKRIKEERIDALNKMFTDINTIAFDISSCADVNQCQAIKQNLVDILEGDLNVELLENRVDEYLKLVQDTIALSEKRIEELEALAKVAEQERIMAEQQAEIEAMKKAEAERQRAEQQRKLDEEREKRHQAELARQKEQAEKDAKAAAEKAERDRIEAEKQAKIAAEEAAERARLAEIARQEEEKRKAEEAEKSRLANEAHVQSIHDGILNSLQNHVDEGTAEVIQVALVNGLIKHVTVNY